MAQRIALIVFDLDDTLTVGLDGGYISGVDYADSGRESYTFTRLEDDLALRNDGQRFRLFPEARPLLAELQQRKVPVSIASYNHAGPALYILQTLDLLRYIRNPVIAWSGRKDLMLQRILAAFWAEGFPFEPQETLFIDDDPAGDYRTQMASIGVNFLQKGVDIQRLDEILSHPGFRISPTRARK
jgi:predicted phosphatase